MTAKNIAKTMKRLSPTEAEQLADDEEELSLWCRGYLAGTALDDHWLDDKLVLRALTPFAALVVERR